MTDMRPDEPTPLERPPRRSAAELGSPRSAPTSAELQINPVVAEAIEEAWRDSQADDPVRRHEEGGLAVQTHKGHIGDVVMSSIATFEPNKPQVSADAALRIARLDAEQKYRVLSPYRIAIVFEDNHWRID